MGPLRIDRRQEGKVQAETLANYKRYALSLSTWAANNNFRPQSDEEWDDTLVEYLNASPKLTLATFTTTVAAVEFFFPQLKHKMPWTHAILTGWGTMHPTNHTKPLGKWPSKLVACHICHFAQPRLALGMVVQAHTGMRPSEMLGLHAEDIVFPEFTGSSLERSPVLFGLGMRKGTKLKRPQVARLHFKDRDVVAVLADCLRHTPKGQRVFPYTLRQYGAALKKAEAALGMEVGWTPHSARAGFATDCRTEGMDFREIMEAGRWQAETSLRIYLDILGAADISVRLQSRGLGPALRWSAAGWVSYFANVRW